jgi:crotonobetainyl-CoA:carnitine CoA-transferase CaiB-like acyl-CoA transferase
MADPAALADVRVVDLTVLLPGPYCTQLLADLGAEVIKIERPGSGDPARQLSPALFAAVNRGKLSVALDLRQAPGRAHLEALVGTADVFIEGFRPGVAERLGAGYAHLARLNPDLIYCSLSGYGQTGPARDLPGHDLNYLGVVGALDPPDQPGTAPRHWGSVPMADLAGALFAANSILAALVRCARQPVGKRGAYLDASLAGAALALVSGRLAEAGQAAVVDDAPLLRGGGYRAFVGSDGQAFTVGCIEDAFWQRLCAALGRMDLASDPRWATFPQRSADAPALDAMLAAEFARLPRAEWLARLREADVPIAPVNTPSTAPADPFVAGSGLLLRDAAPDTGGPAAPPRVRGVRYPVRMPGLATPHEQPDTRRAPALGEHNALLLSEPTGA